ncbi:hypothetical protein K504DRAFT_498836 [Pleomassaria siparia CBS 279.74]|uniref:Uncharacterized protein n=1 Tax=Pleomassaria siparia CBS 279.74 TaxID=1314801 RepID=A0A6G1KN41_9PLEO|nr:hypothetical protein K504DRAFT_498836 [Pleomassaria siparia CBS 279.74]
MASSDLLREESVETAVQKGGVRKGYQVGDKTISSLSAAFRAGPGMAEIRCFSPQPSSAARVGLKLLFIFERHIAHSETLIFSGIKWLMSGTEIISIVLQAFPLILQGANELIPIFQGVKYWWAFDVSHFPGVD